MKKRYSAAGFLVVLACIGLTRVSHSPNFDAIRNVDMVQLIAAGACLGVALTLLLTKKPA
jgi:hypothetical protein